MSSTENADGDHPHIQANLYSNPNCNDGTNEEVHQEKLINTVQSRRGRWVIKLAVALFLMRRGITNVSELGLLHSELWRHESLGRESCARGYVEEDTNLFTAESVWKRKLGRMWMEKGFEACEKELEPYLIKEFAKHRPCTKTENNNEKKDEEEKKEQSTVVKMEDVREYVKLYQDALRYARSVGFAEREEEQGWITATELFHHLQKIYGLPIKENTDNTNNNTNNNSNSDYDDMNRDKCRVRLPTTTAELLSLLQRLDLLGRLQFRLNNNNENNNNENNSGGITKEKITSSTTREDCIRATWAYNNEAIGAAVMASQPQCSLHEALKKFSPSVALYDFVEDVNVWRREMKKYGGRAIPLFRPFLLLIPGDSLQELTTIISEGNNNNGNNDNNNIIGVSALVASKITHKSAFIRISEKFLQLHNSHCVHVIHSSFTSTATQPLSTSEAMVLFLLSVNEVDAAAMALHKTSDVHIIKATLLYGSDNNNDNDDNNNDDNANIAVDALCPTWDNDDNHDHTCNTENIIIDRCQNHLTQNKLYLNELPLPLVQETKQLMALKNNLMFNTEAARNCLRLIAHESKLAHDIAGIVTLGDICIRWLLTNTNLLHDNDHSSITSSINNTESTTLSLILPRNEPGNDKGVCGRHEGIQHLNKELEEAVYAPLCVLSRYNKRAIRIYCAKGVDRDYITTTPLLFIGRPQQRKDHLQGAMKERETTEEECSHSVLVLPLTASNRNYEHDGKEMNESDQTGKIDNTKRMINYIAIEMDKKETQQWLFDSSNVDNSDNNNDCNNNDTDTNVDNDADKDDNNDNVNGALSSVKVLVDEWVLVAAPPINKFIESQFIIPMEQQLRSQHTCKTPFTQLSEETQTALLQSLREQLLIAVTPGKNEALEYLGDAMLDFLVVQKELNTWKGGSLAGGAANRNLATCLPDTVSQHLLLLYGISNKKRRADVVEALIGAVVQALWIIPRQAEMMMMMGDGNVDNLITIDTTTTDNNKRNTLELHSELLPFSCVIQAVQVMMAVMKID
ncbi:uncharacterized protein TM35_000332080 [Trypanosoma theileri]|uniref:Kinetoplastid DICER KptA ADP-ribosyltransferase domain-containing protein n=1 Tax=Trypanosoma theileri TaxID=67003 RepID=A0A1X0NME4_9TRYP|nr:uncharacterized protein TM35_000332080 [Trypanosoma theileri]ORC85751.1 hypothetical protein TM35_000332080 [Trypanosoma theileri]